MRYVDTFSFTPTIATIDTFSYRANSIFDPDQSGIGHQPMGRDQWATFYQHYTVLGSRCSVRCLSVGTSTPAIFGVRPTWTAGFSPSYVSVSGIMEDPRVSYRLLQTAVNGNVPRAAVSKWSAKKWFNLADTKDNPDVGADFGSSPIQEAYFTCFLASVAGTTLGTNQNFVVVLDYIVALSNPKDLPQS